MYKTSMHEHVGYYLIGFKERGLKIKKCEFIIHEVSCQHCYNKHDDIQYDEVFYNRRYSVKHKLYSLYLVLNFSDISLRVIIIMHFFPLGEMSGYLHANKESINSCASCRFISPLYKLSDFTISAAIFSFTLFFISSALSELFFPSFSNSLRSCRRFSIHSDGAICSCAKTAGMPYTTMQFSPKGLRSNPNRFNCSWYSIRSR